MPRASVEGVDDSPFFLTPVERKLSRPDLRIEPAWSVGNRGRLMFDPDAEVDADEVVGMMDFASGEGDLDRERLLLGSVSTDMVSSGTGLRGELVIGVDVPVGLFPKNPSMPC